MSDWSPEPNPMADSLNMSFNSYDCIVLGECYKLFYFDNCEKIKPQLISIVNECKILDKLNGLDMYMIKARWYDTTAHHIPFHHKTHFKFNLKDSYVINACQVVHFTRFQSALMHFQLIRWWNYQERVRMTSIGKKNQAWDVEWEKNDCALQLQIKYNSVCMCACVCLCLYLYVCVCLSLYLYVCVYVYVCKCLYMCLPAWMCVHICKYVYACVCMCMCGHLLVQEGQFIVPPDELGA